MKKKSFICQLDFILKHLIFPHLSFFFFHENFQILPIGIFFGEYNVAK